MSLQLIAPCSFEESIRRSRFRAYAAPIQTEADTLRVYEQAADPGANHNCWAWRLDGRGRFNDDGEPAGSAGRPMLALLESRNLDGVMVIVTRYFGGIKLGVGGLIRAYGGSAGKCLDQGEWQKKVRWLRCELVADFDLSGTVHQLLDRYGAEKQSESFSERGMVLQLSLTESSLEPLRKDLAEASRGQAKLWLSR